MKCHECGWDGVEDDLVEREGKLTSVDREMIVEFFMGVTRTEQCCPQMRHRPPEAIATFTGYLNLLTILDRSRAT